ncbi:MAG: methyl-accepting chemotaxis sensory transducer [Firmicutes bacterium]|nr:methyl-accepting chemotaxis sensory transducer [Bacillota bacterium]
MRLFRGGPDKAGRSRGFRLSLAVKLTGGALLLCAMVLGLGVLSLWQMQNINVSASRISNRSLPRIQLINRISTAHATLKVTQFELLRTTDKYIRQDKNDTLLKLGKQIEQDSTEYQALIENAEEQAAFRTFTEVLGRFNIEATALSDLALKGDDAQAWVALDRAGKYHTESGIILERLLELNRNDAAQEVTQASGVYMAVRNQMALFLIITVVLALGLNIWLAWSLSRPIRLTTRAARKLAEGDLTIEALHVTTRDEVQDLAQAFNAMLQNMRHLIQQVTQTSERLASSGLELSDMAKVGEVASSQAAAAVEQMASGAQRQSNLMSSTSATVEELTAAIAQISEGASEQARHAQQAASVVNGMVDTIDRTSKRVADVLSAAGVMRQTAMDGRQVVEETVGGIQRVAVVTEEVANRISELEVASSEIGKILGVITNIASQTNLLALNAAIEAARAGEHGRGFAVVAEEVRKLAEQSAVSAREIRELVEKVQEYTKEAVFSVDRGSKEVELCKGKAADAGLALMAIVTTAEDTAQNISSIATALEQVSEGSREVMTVVDNVAAISQENSASTEEMAAGSTEVAAAVNNVSGIAEETATASEQVNATTGRLTDSSSRISNAAGELADMAQQLRQVIGGFKL